MNALNIQCKMKGARDKYAGAWVLANTSLSALLYIVDFVTNIITLRTYYYIEMGCSNSSTGVCSSIRREYRIGNFDSIFVVGLSLMVGAHISNSFIFWMTLPAADHPLRLAYFLPLIHLSRLLKVIWRTCSFEGLKEYKEEESSNLYNVLSASLETVPQLMLQFHVAMDLGLGLTSLGFGESDPQPIPKALIISIVASLVSGIYNGSMAVLFLVQKQGMSFQRRAFISIIAGVHTLAAMAAKTMIVAALAGPVDKYIHVAAPLAYFLAGGLITWVFFGFLLRRSQHNCIRRSNWLSHALHCLALAHVSLFIGPMYVIVKHFDEPYVLLIWGTLLHIFVELLGFIDVIVIGRHQNGWQIWDPPPCNAMPKHEWEDSHPFMTVNIYLTCNFFLGVLFPSLLVLLLSTVLFVVVNKRGRCGRLSRRDACAAGGADEIVSQDQELQLIPINSSITRKSSSLKFYTYAFVVIFIKKLRGSRHQRPYVCSDEAEVPLVLQGG